MQGVCSSFYPVVRGLGTQYLHGKELECRLGEEGLKVSGDCRFIVSVLEVCGKVESRETKSYFPMV